MMRRFYADESLTDEGKKILRAFAAYTVRLHEAGILHVDYSPGNIAFAVSGEEVSFSLFDINRMRFGRAVAPDVPAQPLPHHPPRWWCLPI